MLAALNGTGPDRLPVTTHHIMPYYLDHCLDGMSERAFWDEFDLDAYCWTMPHKPAPGSNDYPDPLQTKIGFLESHRVANDSWRVFEQDVSKDGRKLTRYNFVTPRGAPRRGDRSRGVHGLGARAAGQTQARYRPHRRLRHHSALRRRSPKPGSCGLRRSRPGTRHHLPIRRLWPGRLLAGCLLPGRGGAPHHGSPRRS